jgi:cell division protein FtsB
MQDGIYPSIRALMGAIQAARQTKDVEALEEEIQRLKDAIDFWREGLEEDDDPALELRITIAKRGVMLLEDKASRPHSR